MPPGVRPLCWASVAAIAFASGCQLLTSRQRADSAYERARAEIEGERAADSPGGVRKVSFEAPDPNKDPKELSWRKVTPEGITETLKEAVGLGRDPELAKNLYREAEAIARDAAQDQSAQRTAKFRKAAGLFAQAASRWPDSALQQDALYMVGECHFFADAYYDANEAFENLLKYYPNTRLIDQVEARRFSIAQYWLAQERQRPEQIYEFNFFDERRPTRDRHGHAIRVFDKIRLDDPTGKLADDATLAAANAHFARGDYLEADDFYTDLRKTFPSSEHQFNAHYLGMKAKLESYQGTAYQGTELDEAEKLVKQIFRQFPAEAAQERQALNEAYAEIRFKQAERSWTRAQYFERRGEYGAAREEYQSLLARFREDNPFHGKARERMEAIRDRPAHPPQRLSWLVRMFPDPNARPVLTPKPDYKPKAADELTGDDE